MASLTIENVTKKFGAVEVLKGISLGIEPGEFLVRIGGSSDTPVKPAAIYWNK